MDIRLKWSSACRIDFLLFTFFKYSAVFFILVMMQKTIAWRQMFQTVHAVSPACFKHYAARKFGASSWMHKGELCSSLIFHRNHILRRDLTNVPQPFEMSLSNPMLSVIESNEEVKWRRFSQIKREMANCIELHDFDKAQTLYEEIKDKVNLHGNIDTVLMFLSICQHASQIGIVEDVIINLKEQHIGIHEQVYFSLIRCYCDGNMIDKAWEIVKSMEGLGVEPRLRTFQPVLEACERVGDIGETLKVFEYLMNVRLQPRSEQLTALLRTYTQYRELEGDKMDNHHTIKERVDDILKQASTHMIGFPTEDLERIAAGAAGATVEGVRDFGVLVENLEDIDGPVICDEHLHIDSSVIALNATYNSTGRLLDQYSPTPNNPHLPIGLKVEGIHFIPQKFVVWSEKSSKFLQPDNMKFGENDGTSDGGNSNKNHPFCAPTSSSLIMLKNKNPDVEQQLSARLVHIADKNCHCPHCFGKILKIPMSNEEKKEVREALIRTAADQSLTHITHLENFAQWLQSRPEYDYIIDGPNVAYQNQNHFYGRFSYRQIELVVNKLKSMGKRPLVILPSIYSKGNYMIRNSIRRSGAVKKIMLTDSEKEFLDRLDREDMLYAVPRGANDDWYWMYSTLYPGRKTQALVITNDLMRDHKVSFLAPSSFIRWRTSQIVFYSISRNYNQSIWTNPPLLSVNGKSDAMTGIVDVDNDLFIHHSLPGDPNNPSGSLPTLNDMIIDGEVEFFGPGNFSREIQQSDDSGRWHIPALGSNLWLCLKT